MNVAIDLRWIIPVVIGLFFFLRRKNTKPLFFFSSFSLLSDKSILGRSKFASYPRKMIDLAMIFFACALLDPHTYKKMSASDFVSTEGTLLFLALDHSGSMNENNKINILKSVTKQFISARPKDMIGLLEFARGVQVLSPPTLDHQYLLKMLDDLKVVKNPEEDGTALGYAIYNGASQLGNIKNISQISSNYKIKDSALIVVTDGFQSPHPDDRGNLLRAMSLEDASTQAKELGIKINIINIDPEIEKSEFAPHRRLMKNITEKTGGDFFIATTASSLNDVYNKINQLEKSKLPSFEEKTRTVSFYPFLIIIGLLFLLLGILLETTYLRSFP